MAYVEAFVIAVPKDRLEDYKRMARILEPVFRENGARDYVECIGDDTPYGTLTSFPRAVQAKEDEIVIFAWVVYDSREARDNANKRTMEDPRAQPFANNIPFDGKRMIFGGFRPFIGL